MVVRSWEKSSLSGINMDEQRVVHVASSFSCKADHLLILYLSLPLGGNPKLDAFRSPVQERISKKLGIWMRYHL